MVTEWEETQFDFLMNKSMQQWEKLPVVKAFGKKILAIITLKEAIW